MSGKVLIADQSEAVRGVAENLFRKKGLEVVSAADGLEALELVKTTNIDLAFLNSSLPQVDGYTVSSQIKESEKTNNVKVVLLLSTSEIVKQHQLLSSQADDTLNKPFSPQDLVEVTSKLLGIQFDDGSSEKSHSDGLDDISEGVEVLNIEDEPDQEIDFGSIFEGDAKKSSDSDLGDVFISQGDDTEATDKIMTDVFDENKSETKEGDMNDNANGHTEDTIHLADDQYGIEEPLDEEVHTPHDYNWFIREMKKELSEEPSGDKGEGAEKSGEKESPKASATPGVPAKTTTTKTGTFDIEEIGSSRMNVTDQDISADDESDSQKEYVFSGKPTDKGATSGEMSLAEKLLIREIAQRIADSIVERMSSRDLREAIQEALHSLKKM